VDIKQAAQVSDAVYEPFQLQLLNNSTRYGADVKARQIAWSFTAALDAVVDGIPNDDTPHIFVSVNLSEAGEKIRYARNIIEATRPDVRPVVVRESQSGLEFANGSRLISHPCRPPRGKARARIYLDEMAHYQAGMDREIYRAALPATVKGDGYIRIGSSPLGARGLFWEIVTQTMRTYPGFDDNRRFIPWWHVHALCTDPARAMRDASQMLTAQRVEAFGTPALIDIYQNMFLEDFQQEYECAWVDESVSWISWDVIQRNQDPDLLYWHAKTTEEAHAAIPEIQEAIAKGKVESVLAGGIDIGRTHDLTEMVVVGKGTTSQLPVRLMVSLDRVEFDAQEACFREILTALPFTRVLVDQTGIGMQLAENLARTGKAQGVTFTNATKELWAVEARVQAERGNTPIPPDRNLAYQIHSIRRKITDAKNAVFDTEKNEKHHADQFWGWSLGLTAANLGIEGSIFSWA